MTKPGKVALIVGGLVLLVVFFVLPTMWAMKSIAVWWAYWRYVDEVSNLTGISRYLITAGGLLLFIPFWLGTSLAFSLGSRRQRYAGTAILIGLAVFYNLSLFWVTRETSFAFSGGAPQKWYALTPAGVRLYDRPGVDPTYGIPLKPVTPEMVRKLELLQQGEFKPADPTRLTFFNPITGEAQSWYYRYPDGTIEFYDKPGHHPLTGAALEPVSQQIVLEWRKAQRSQPPPSRSGESSRSSRTSAVTLPSPAAGAPEQREKHELLAQAKAKELEQQKQQDLERQQTAFVDRNILKRAGARNAPSPCFAVLVWDSQSGRDAALSDGIAQAFRDRSVTAATEIFKDAFLTDGNAERVLNSNPELVAKLGLNKLCDFVVLGRKSVATTQDPARQGLVTARGSLILKVISTESGLPVQTVTLSDTGGGFKPDTATEQLTEKLLAAANAALSTTGNSPNK